MLNYSFLDDTMLGTQLDTEPITKLFNLLGDDYPKPKPRDLRSGYPVHTKALGPTKECNDLATTGLRALNTNRWALDMCEPWCGRDLCHEYANQLEAYFDCLRCGNKNCKQPVNPRDCGCRSIRWSKKKGARIV